MKTYVVQIEGVDAQHDEESQGAGIEREVVAEGRLAEQQEGEHEGGAHQEGDSPVRRA